MTSRPTLLILHTVRSSSHDARMVTPYRDPAHVAALFVTLSKVADFVVSRCGEIICTPEQATALGPSRLDRVLSQDLEAH